MTTQRITLKKEHAATQVDKACKEVQGFETLSGDLERTMTLNGYSKSTFTNYLRCLAHLSVHCKKLPQEANDREIEDYLLKMKKDFAPSESYFKHTVYGLRFLFRFLGQKERAIKMPRVRSKMNLPVVLSKEECKRLFKALEDLKSRILLCLIYSAGLRLNEARQLKWEDIDRERKQIRIQPGKNRKSRYVMLSGYLVQGLIQYYRQYSPQTYVFNGSQSGEPLSASSIQLIVKSAVTESGIKKHVTTHTLRHSFATHLLEDGVDIVTIKELLGHSQLRSTLTYLHVAHLQRHNAHSPLDTLYGF